LFFEGDDDDQRSRVSDVAASEQALRVIHRAIRGVSEDIESLDLNTAVSALHVAVRDLTGLEERSRAVLEPLAQLIAPFAPHFAEEVWAGAIGKSGGISFVPWPVCDESYVAQEKTEVAVQIDGRAFGAVIELAKDAREDEAIAAACAHTAVARRLAGRAVVKVIYKAGRVVNLVTRGGGS
jgi:leucyl-tRNA synthetase